MSVCAARINHIIQCILICCCFYLSLRLLLFCFRCLYIDKSTVYESWVEEAAGCESAAVYCIQGVCVGGSLGRGRGWGCLFTM